MSEVISVSDLDGEKVGILHLFGCRLAFLVLFFSLASLYHSLPNSGLYSSTPEYMKVPFFCTSRKVLDKQYLDS